MKKMARKAVFLLLFLWALPQNVLAAKTLIPVGQVIGLELADDTVSVAAFDETLGAGAQKAGLQVGDRLLKLDGRAVRSTEDVRDGLNAADGTVQLQIQRDGKNKNLKLTPVITAQGPKLGVYLKEGITGVGTVTYFDPETGNYGALGHGVNTADGALLQLRRGQAYEAQILSVRKGRCGTPGQLMGALESECPLGSIVKNTPCGIFGNAPHRWDGEALEICQADQVHTGDAVIRSAVSGNRVQEYSVQILKIYPLSTHSGRNMLLRITDQDLLNTTGGIVQGMSGSPIIQDGKLIGAVTHVLVNDPQTGYGIFIENMLQAAA